jgi:hypothetical protein
MSGEYWIPLAIIAGIIGFWFVAVVAACLWEKRPVQPYYVPAPGEEYAPSSVAERENRDAEKLGYRHGGLCHDGKGTLYRVRYDFWIAPDDSTIAEVGSGTVAGIAVNAVWLWSRLAEGLILYTTNEAGGQDISGSVDQQTWPGTRLRELVEKHQRRLRGLIVDPVPAANPLAALFDMRRAKFAALVARGYGYYVDDEQTACRYTLKGAIVFYFVSAWARPISRFLRSVGLGRERA